MSEYKYIIDNEAHCHKQEESKKERQEGEKEGREEGRSEKYFISVQ